MAITKLLHIKAKSNLYAAIAYVMRPEKTENGLLVGGNSGNEPQEVYRIMQQTKQDWEKPDGRQGYHFILSWKPGETDAQTAYGMIKEFCEAYLGDGYDYVFAVHNDRDHPHGHIVFNSVNRITGYKYRYETGDWEKKIQPVTDQICERYHLSRLTYDRENPVGISYAEWNRGEKMTWKKIICADIDYAIARSSDYDEFLQIMRKMKYQIKCGSSRMEGEEGEVLSLKAPGQNRAWRTKKSTLGEAYTVAAIKERIRKPSKVEFSHDPMPPRLKRCRSRGRLKSNSGLSGYQFLFVKEIYLVSVRYMRSNPFAVNAGQVRKNWLQIEKLRRDCAYLIREQIHNRDELVKRDAQLREEFSHFKRNHEILSILKGEKKYQEYFGLKKKLARIAPSDDRFETILDQMEHLQKELPVSVMELEKITGQMHNIRQERQVIRHIRKMDQEWQRERKHMKSFPDSGRGIKVSVGNQKSNVKERR